MDMKGTEVPRLTLKWMFCIYITYLLKTDLKTLSVSPIYDNPGDLETDLISAR